MMLFYFVVAKIHEINLENAMYFFILVVTMRASPFFVSSVTSYKVQGYDKY